MADGGFLFLIWHDGDFGDFGDGVSYDNQSSSKLNPTTGSTQSSAGDDETAKTWSWSWTPSPIGGTVNM